MVKDQRLELLSQGAFDENGVLKNYRDQLNEYAYGEMRSGDQFVLAIESAELGLVECPNLPVTMKQSVVRKVTTVHELSLEQLKDLPEWIMGHPLALDSLEDVESIVLITEAKDLNDNEIIIALHLEKEYRQVVVNSIASIYGKRNLAYLVENTIAAGKNVYVNERTGDWLRRTGIPFPERIANHLQQILYQSEARTGAIEIPERKPPVAERVTTTKDIASATRSAEALSPKTILERSRNQSI